MRTKRIAIALVAMVVVAGLAAGLVSGVFGSVARSGLYATGLWSSNGPSTLPSDSLNTPTPSSAQPATPRPSPTEAPTPQALPSPVLAAATSAPVPQPAKVTARIKGVKVSGVGSSYSGSVVDVGTGKVLFAHNAKKAYIPASTMKLLTSTAALSILGPEHRFTTKVVSPKSGRIILVGGGDPYLAKKTTASTFPKRASMPSLAKASAAALKKKKVTKVSLGYDDSLFSGPRWNVTWPDLYSDQVTPVSALWVDEGRVNGGSPGARVANPSRDAAETFAAALRKQGIKVTDISAERAKASAAKVASVQSMSLERIVQQLLLVSDNDAAEVVFRQAAIGAGKKGSFADGVSVVRSRLTKLGVWDAADKINDGSGLSRKTHVSSNTMVKLLRLDAEGKHPELRGVITGLSVAGVEGSLRTHYSDDESLTGRGLVRGKTGTLTKVHSLAGLIRAKDGSLMAYAFLINNAKNDFNAKVWLDRTTAALSSCGCR